MNIYVASSFANPFQPEVIKELRNMGHDVYDFHKNPNTFSWDQINITQPANKWNSTLYAEEMKSNLDIDSAFKLDYLAIQKADCCLLLLPCGKSAHLEAGLFKGQGKIVYALTLEKEIEPELMYKFFDKILTSIEELRLTFS